MGSRRYYLYFLLLSLYAGLLLHQVQTAAFYLRDFAPPVAKDIFVFEGEDEIGEIPGTFAENAVQRRLRSGTLFAGFSRDTGKCPSLFFAPFCLESYIDCITRFEQVQVRMYRRQVIFCLFHQPSWLRRFNI